MPYIGNMDRGRLNPLIENLHNRVVELCEKSGDARQVLYGYFRYIANRVLESAAMDAVEQYQGERKVRYWLIVDFQGIAMNIASELFDRVLAGKPKYETQTFKMFCPLPSKHLDKIPGDSWRLNAELSALTHEIAMLSGPNGHNYEGAYCGLVNYSMSILMPKVMMTLFDRKKLPQFTDIDIEHLISFWVSVAMEFYSEIARPYEDKQIEKSGDVEVYEEVLKRLPPA